jgi:SAM-dependent methyltransferase
VWVVTAAGTSWSLPKGSLERWPEDYERGRPGWPPEVVDVVGLPLAATVVDLGAGTGKLTRLLVPRFDRVVAVEPAEPMLRLLVRLCPDARAVNGTGQQIPLTVGSVDAIFAAQSFHWFDDRAALAEMVRVLGPAGELVLMWNLPDGPTRPSITAVEELLNREAPKGDLGYDPLDLGHGPRYASGEWRAELARAGFGPVQEARVPHLQVLDRDGLVAYFASMGWIADLPDADRLPLLDEVRSLLIAHEYRRLWQTHLLWTRLSIG